MASIKEIADDLVVTMGLISDDTQIDIRSLYYWINAKRSLLIHNELTRSLFINPLFSQILPCMPLELVDQNMSYCCNDLPTKCQILRTTLKLPKTIPYRGNYGILAISSPMILGKEIKLVDNKNFKYVGNGRHNNKDVFCTVIDDYIYIRTKTDISQNVGGKSIMVKLIAEDPLDLSEYPSCNSKNSDRCNPENDAYPLPDYLLNTLKQMVLKEDLQLALMVPEDNSNNSVSDVIQKQ